MLNRQQLKEYRLLRGVSTWQVAKHCEISQPLIVQVENGVKRVTPYNHEQIVNGINEAYKEKCNNPKPTKK